MLFVSQNTRAARLEICKGCEHFNKSTRSCGTLLKKKKVKGGTLCGCFMPAKASLKSEACPIGKWGPTVNPQDLAEIREFVNSLENFISRDQNEKLVEMYRDRSRRKLVIIDESWDLMGSGSSGSFIEAGYRRARKYGGAFGTITQSVDDYYKNEATKAAINNADWLFLLRQKAENIERLGKEGKLSLDEWLKRQLGSVSTEHGHFSEIYIHSPMGSGLGRLLLDPFSMLVYSTRAEDYEAIKRLREQGLSVAEAIEQLVTERATRS